MKLNRSIIFGSITGGILLFILSYSVFGRNNDDNNSNTNYSPNFESGIRKNSFGDYFESGESGESKAPVFGGSKKSNITKNKKRIKKTKTMKKK